MLLKITEGGWVK